MLGGMRSVIPAQYNERVRKFRENLQNEDISQNYMKYFEYLMPKYSDLENTYVINSWTYITNYLFSVNNSTVELTSVNSIQVYQEFVAKPSAIIQQKMPNFAKNASAFVGYYQPGSTFRNCVLDPNVSHHLFFDRMTGGLQGRINFVFEIKTKFSALLNSQSALDFYDLLVDLLHTIAGKPTHMLILILDNLLPVLTTAGFVPFLLSIIYFVRSPTSALVFCKELLSEIRDKLTFTTMTTITYVRTTFVAVVKNPRYLIPAIMLAYSIYNGLPDQFWLFLKLLAKLKPEDCTNLRTIMEIIYLGLTNVAASSEMSDGYLFITILGLIFGFPTDFSSAVKYIEEHPIIQPDSELGQNLKKAIDLITEVRGVIHRKLIGFLLGIEIDKD